MSTDFGLPASSVSGPNGKENLPGLFAPPTNVVRSFEYDLFSSGRIAAGGTISGTQMQFFNYALGTAGPGFAAVSSVSETNVDVGGMMPGGQTFNVTAVAVEIYGDAGTAPLIGDVRSVMRLGYLVWRFGQTTNVPIAPIPMVGAGGGIFGFTADSGTPVTQANNGNGGLWLYQQVVVAIPSTQAFRLECLFGTGGQAAAITVTAATQLRAHLFNMAQNAVPVA